MRDVRAVNTVIQYQNCEIKRFMLKWVNDLATWLLGVRKISGNVSLRCQRNGL